MTNQSPNKVVSTEFEGLKIWGSDIRAFRSLSCSYLQSCLILNYIKRRNSHFTFPQTNDKQQKTRSLFDQHCRHSLWLRRDEWHPTGRKILLITRYYKSFSRIKVASFDIHCLDVKEDNRRITSYLDQNRNSAFRR